MEITANFRVGRVAVSHTHTHTEEIREKRLRKIASKKRERVWGGGESVTGTPHPNTRNVAPSCQPVTLGDFKSLFVYTYAAMNALNSRARQ